MLMGRLFRTALYQSVGLLLLSVASNSIALCQQSGTPFIAPLRDRAVKIVEPVYPKEARRRGIKGNVAVELMIDEEGNVASTKALTGHRLLRVTATEAAKQWRFTPVELGGKPVKYVDIITFDFPAKSALTNLAALKPANPVNPQVEAEVMRLLDEYMSAWNRKDMVEWERTFQFPHFRLASGKMNVLERPGLQNPALWATMAKDGWHHSKWDRRRIIHVSDDKVHVDTQFTRYRVDGTKIGSYESLYIVTKENGHWGVKMRSSFAQ